MPEQIIEDNWPLGWCPSLSSQADFGQASQALLRMDNLSLDEKGSLRLADSPSNEGNAGGSVHSIFAAFMNNLKYRYVYLSNGTLKRNYGGSNSISVYDLTIGTGATTNKANFITALGHTLCLAGSLQVKDRGDIQWSLTIPTPTAPVLTNEAASVVDMRNLDGSGNYTNWTSVQSSAFNNSSTTIVATGAANNVLAFRTIFSSVVDTTNFGLTGEDTPNDLLSFNFEIDDYTQLNSISIELMLQDPTAGPVTDEYFCTVGIIYTSLNSTGVGTASMPVFPSGQKVALTIPRQDFLRTGTNSSLSWATVKAIWVTVNTFTPTQINFDTIFFGSGAVTGDQSYVCAEYNDTGQFVQSSIISTQVDVTASVNFIKVDRSGAACNSQCNEIRFYRKNTTLGQFIEVARQTGAYGFTPTSFIDNLSDANALAAAAINNDKILQFYRTNLPTNIIGAIYFAARVIYLTQNSFIPSYLLDLGTYDSRFTYELNATNSELCLFIAKLSVGTFIIATTVDFYQVSGDFSLVSTANADGTTTTVQNVTIQPLGVSDPAISSNFMEVEGNIFYISARGLRSMSNGVSSLLNTTTELLFRNENRYGIPPIALSTANDSSLIGLISSGTRLYVALPFEDGTNRIMVSTYNPPLPTELRGANYWRLLTQAAQCLCREQDGTVLYGDSSGNIGGLENAFNGSLPIYFQTQFNFGQHPAETKTLGSLLLYVNTGNNRLTATVNGLKEDGTVLTYTTTIQANGLKIIALDPHTVLVDCIAYQLVITGNTTAFELAYLIYITVQEYPPLTFYALVPFSNLGKDTLKKLSKWGFVVDTLGSSVTVTATADNKAISSEIDHSAEPQGISTEFWYNNEDLAALDWQLEVVAPNGMHFFKFMNPDILQVYPPGRLIDQIGPIDLDLEGLAYQFRMRLINEGPTVHYEIFDNDVQVFSEDVNTPVGVDTTFIEKLPKGINTSVLRIIITSPTVFYRFSLEVQVRSTGKESDQKWVKIGSK